MDLVYKSMLILILGSFLVGCQRSGDQTVSGAPFSFAVGADPQLFMRQKDDKYWQETIDRLIGMNPDLFVVCGDLINAPNRAEKWEKEDIKERNEKEAAAYLKGVERLREHVKVYNVAGNHDVALEPTPKTLAWYEQRFGMPWYSFSHKKSLFVILESNLIRSPQGAPAHAERQLSWLKATLEENEKENFQHKFAFMHHPLCLKDINEKDSYYNIQIEKRKELIELFQKHNFSAVFSGHLHKNNYLKLDDLELITTSSCCVPLGKDPREVNMVHVNPDRIEHEYISFEEKEEVTP